ncbi:MAG: alpha-galactosidase, partial [Firmicutes bacterium]|nr:alpha-galactosidase [Bacillota bacterium]
MAEKFARMETTARDMELVRVFYEPLICLPQNIPIAYKYGGKVYRGLPENASVFRRFLDANMEEIVFRARLDGHLAVRAEFVLYRDYPVVEWTAFFECDGKSPSGMLSYVKAIDVEFLGSNSVVVSNNGDFFTLDSYTESRTPLPDGAVFAQEPRGGRPCEGAFPYQRLLFDGFGVNISIGWPGMWSCAYRGVKGGAAFSAGQKTVNTVVNPGETLRTPRMTVQFFDGDEKRGINLWRRWFNAHVTPRSKGRIVQPKTTVSDHGGGIEYNKADENNQMQSIAYIKENLPDAGLWWIDAGWYDCLNIEGTEQYWGETGSWFPDPARFPRGLKPVGDACKDAGMDLLVWFEPERVRASKQLYKEHPEWMLKASTNQYDSLLDLSKPECVKWLSETYIKLIRESAITCYRQDYNIAPLDFWRENEAADRRGMLENLYV